jgi:hypothetical protein
LATEQQPRLTPLGVGQQSPVKPEQLKWMVVVDVGILFKGTKAEKDNGRKSILYKKKSGSDCNGR